MSLLNDLLTLSEGSDLNELPPDVMSELQKNIRDGASDKQQEWANALALVHKAFEVAGVQRPTPDMKGGWKQYEELLQLAVSQLADNRGMDGDWRMSSSIFHEAMQKQVYFRVFSNNAKSSEAYKIRAKSIDDIVDGMEKNNQDLYDIKVDRPTPQKAVLTFSKWGIKRNHRVTIEQLI